MSKVYVINDNGAILTEAGVFKTPEEAQKYINALGEDEDPYLMSVATCTCKEEMDFLICLDYSEAYSEYEKEELLKVLIGEDNPCDLSDEQKVFIFKQYSQCGYIDYLEVLYEKYLYSRLVGYSGFDLDGEGCDFDDSPIKSYKDWVVEKLNKSLSSLNELEEQR